MISRFLNKPSISPVSEHCRRQLANDGENEKNPVNERQPLRAASFFYRKERLIEFLKKKEGEAGIRSKYREYSISEISYPIVLMNAQHTL
jgi:hypothetical protein